jgi:segregation and condensation protein B
MAESSPFEFDLETAYRQALQAVEAADLPADHWAPPEDDRGSSDSDSPDSDSPDILPFSPPATDASAAGPPSAVAEAPRVSPRQILEAALFVGGVELTAEKLATLLKGDFTPEFVARTLDDLNGRYTAERRPYEIRCEEGLYRLALRPEFEPIRRRVFGLGPKEVKLTQDALEVLSLVAYRQPISRAEIESLRDGNTGNVLRQLVRRQLVAIRRDGEAPDEARYVTTSRFLEVFGLADLDELPRAEDLNFK